MSAKLEYPAARRDETVTNDFHGITIQDPYRWLEDPDSTETKTFVNEQNALSNPYIHSYQHRELVNKTLTKMWNYPKFGCPHKRGPRYFYGHNSGLQNQSVTYMMDDLEAEPQIFIDPNTFSEDGTVSVSSKKFTKDGSLCALSLSSSGSDWKTIKFINVETKEYLPDVLKKVKFSCLAFTPDNKGFFYNCFPSAADNHEGEEVDQNLNQKLFFHRMGTDQSEDIICAEFPDNPHWMSAASVSDCQNYLLLEISESCKPVNKLYYYDMRSHGSEGFTGLIPFIKLIDKFDAEYDYITNEGTVFTFKTNLDASRYRVITIDFENPGPENWKTLIPEHPTDVLENITCVNQNKLIVIYMHDVKNEMYVHDLATGERKAKFPLEVGSIGSLSGRKEDTEIFYSFTSFLAPSRIYRCSLTTDSVTPAIFRDNQIAGIDVSNFETSQVFYSSKDGTKIPMFIVHRKDLPRDGNNPVWLYGYGGFNISLTPYFSISRLLYLKHFNGIFALPNIRGGGEYGEEWHKGGKLDKKQNCFDDFISAAEYLIQEKYTQASRITINGGSNGGLLVGACINQRPDLFGAGISDVGVLDMLRFHKFTIGHYWVSDYGCSDNKEDFEYIIKYSPLHTVKEPIIGQFPALLVCTADHDDRVAPLHSLKYMATVQHVLGKSEKQTNPLLLQVECKAGHGAGKPTAKIIEEVTDKIAFMALTTGLEWRD
ncbi:PREP [Bugula neritina]|uniref:Prolyl endopeptidase n=1 Tax=Bugula neritina TaxID=10212 RepID=A0A7J7JT60_BUGNE|nr:PREP [Bugula neritina]